MRQMFEIVCVCVFVPAQLGFILLHCIVDRTQPIHTTFCFKCVRARLRKHQNLLDMQLTKIYFTMMN